MRSVLLCGYKIESTEALPTAHRGRPTAETRSSDPFAHSCGNSAMVSFSVILGAGRISLPVKAAYKAAGRSRSRPSAKMSHLCSSGIDFDQMCIPRVRLQHEIETVQPGKL